MTEFEALGESFVSGEEIFDGKVLHVFRDQVRLPNGGTSEREVIKHLGAVCIVPLTDDGKMIVERQYRYAVGEVLTEIPAGKLDYPGEDWLEAAKRELREETGLSADEWRELGFFFPAAAYSGEKIMMFLARGLHQGERELDEDEFLSVQAVPVAELLDEVMRGELPDSKTQIAILKAARILAEEEK